MNRYRLRAEPIVYCGTMPRSTDKGIISKLLRGEVDPETLGPIADRGTGGESVPDTSEESSEQRRGFGWRGIEWS